MKAVRRYHKGGYDIVKYIMACAKTGWEFSAYLGIMIDVTAISTQLYSSSLLAPVSVYIVYT